MRWPWSEQQELKQVEIKEQVLTPALKEVKKAHDHLDRIDRILREAREAELVVVQSKRKLYVGKN